MADSLHRATHVMRTRKAHQITAAALYILQHHTYDHYTLTCAEKGELPVGFEAWHDERKRSCPQFQHPDIYREFSAGHFTVQKTKRVFSAIPIDQAHEQTNTRVKGDGGGELASQTTQVPCGSGWSQDQRLPE